MSITLEVSQLAIVAKTDAVKIQLLFKDLKPVDIMGNGNCSFELSQKKVIKCIMLSYIRSSLFK